MDLNLDYCNSHSKLDNYHSLNKTFDIVTAWKLSTSSLLSLFDKLNQITNKGGVCVVETNNVAYLKDNFLSGGSNLDFELVDKYNLNSRSIKHPHIRFYSLRN